MSPFYFQRGFKILKEMTPSEYISNRRLYLAALDFLGGKEKVIDKNCAWNKAFFLLYYIRDSVLIFYRICCESDFVDDGEFMSEKEIHEKLENLKNYSQISIIIGTFSFVAVLHAVSIFGQLVRNFHIFCRMSKYVCIFRATTISG